MAAYVLNSPVVVFDHKEHGKRLLFKNGITNPRDILGKNGVTFHNLASSLFYKTIKIHAKVIDDSGATADQVFYINRNSLIKYMGEETYKNATDDELMADLNQKILWNDDNNQGLAQKEKQIQAGEHGLRHAGRHNTRFVDNWRVRFTDFVKGSFLSWLYQKTIVGVNAIKARFLFVSSEADLLEAGEVLAKKRFHEAYKEIPAYKHHITRFNGIPTSDTQFKDIPKTDKANYIKYQQYDSDTHFGGKYPVTYKKDTSTGTTGKPTEWVRGEKELDAVRHSLKLAAKLQFGDRKLNYVNAFAFGPWATGLTTYELMRETGSIFATGADKEKIFDHLVSNRNYELHQLDLAVDKLLTENPDIYPNKKQFIVTLIDESIKALLKNRDSSFEDEFAKQFQLLNSNARNHLSDFRDEIVELGLQINKERNQVVIAGYPPFLKDLVDYVKQKGHNFADFSAIGVVGGQAISEASRDQLKQHGFNEIYSSYGASDLDINLGVETDYEISVRKAIEENPGLSRELFGENKGLPMVFHYDPMNYHVECEDDNDLIMTCARDDRSSARIRYNLGDKGRVYASSDVQALLAKYGIFQKPKSNLPLMFVWGRDSTVVFVGANLAFTELERAVTTNPELESIVLKKAFYAYQDESGSEKFEIWLELNDGVELPNQHDLHKHSDAILNNLVCLNQDFKYQVDKLDKDTELPRVRFFKRGESPISDAGGHRKQVLIFQKGVNLPIEYQFPTADKAVSYALPKSDTVMRAPVQSSLVLH